MIRVILPAHLRTLAHVDGEVKLDAEGHATELGTCDPCALSQVAIADVG